MTIQKFEDTPAGAPIVARQRAALAAMLEARDQVARKATECSKYRPYSYEARAAAAEMKALTERKAAADKELFAAQSALTNAQAAYGIQIKPELLKARDAAVTALSRHLADAVRANAEVSTAEQIMESHGIGHTACVYSGLGVGDTQYSRWASRCHGQKIDIVTASESVRGAIRMETSEMHQVQRDAFVLGQRSDEPLISAARDVISTGRALFGR